MRDTAIHLDSPAATARRSTAVDRAARALVMSRLRRRRHGTLTIVENGSTERLVGDESHDLRASVTVVDSRFYRSVVLGGSLGVAEAFIRGWWTSDDLTSLLRMFVRDMATTDAMERGSAGIGRLLGRIAHGLRRNTRSGSRRNIHAHYDLGNEFFALWLDESMTYSAAIYDERRSSLRDAQVAKLDRICRKLELSRADHVLEIGTGWGSFAIHAATNYGCRVTTTTLSREQRELARRRITAAGVDDRVTVELTDYRDLTGTYDKLVSIEMIEAVGHAYLGEYFATCASLLRDEGMMLLQAITMPDQRYERYRRSVDFIQRYVFPGSCVPSIAAMNDAMRRSSDLRLTHLEDIGPHYARTLRDWRRRFFERIDDVRAQGYPETFIRLWEYYLCYCEAGFEERYIGDVQMLLAKPRSRREPIVSTIERSASNPSGLG